MPLMAKKKTPVNSTAKPAKTSRVVVMLDTALVRLIDEQADESDRTRTAEISRALKGYYKGLGLTPIPLPQDDD